MQPRTEAPRDGLTSTQVVSLLQDASAVTMSGGMEVIDLGLNMIEDISDDFAGGKVTRNSYDVMHAALEFRISRPLDWGAGLVRPYITITSGAVSARFNLGAYHTNTPKQSTAESPPTFDVHGYDMLRRLNQQVGDAYAIDKTQPYLAKIEEILLGRGYLAYVIDQTAAATVTPTTRTWAFDESITWLTIVNDMLASVGYAGIWADWNGRLRCEPYVLPASRAIEWYYSDNPLTTMMDPERIVDQDYTDAPNRWVFYRQNNVDDVQPIEGNGMYTVENQSLGPTSIDARGGLVITRPVALDAADQAALIAQGDAIVQADRDVPTVITATTFPNPLHWHFDRLYLQDSVAMPFADVQCTDWSLTLPPDLPVMEQTWRVISL